MNSFSCCKGCPTRTPGCHDRCEQYQKDKAEWDAIRDKRYQEKALYHGLEEQKFRGVYKAQRTHGKKIGNGKG